MSDLVAEPSFIARDPDTILAELVAAYEEASGRTLFPGQIERLLINLVAYRETLLRVQIQEAALQNLVAFARAPMLDFLGELVATTRLPAAAATTSLRFTLSAVQAVPITVPAGSRVQAADGQVFATTSDLVIATGSTFGDVVAQAAIAGVGGNGYGVGAVTAVLDPAPAVATASNTVVTAGGAEIEDDERYRDRIRQAPEQFSVAGSAQAYRFHAFSASSAVADVSVVSPSSGVVRLYVVATTGLPTTDLLDTVEAAVSGERVRPLSDTVEVVAPTEVTYAITATIRPLAGADAEAVMTAAQAAAEAYAADRRAGLGRDIVTSQVVTALSVPGVYEVTLAEPDGQVLDAGEWSNCTAITLTQGTSGDG